ncbi:hypothetical protein JSQ81_10325 [Sporosarcina sp. Marseille-Q4063]|uniref:hypothetical protein n=1 Tax=Sporosarcina sp. Marseille-Q4063 TaxID=2810514 RepID=UPI001BAF2FAF|nr:hypothetical protein [Sporosarcina sp. Marseille-Q4063]QUW20275.1 hypothetical protein JSQ81_10325 [Sporosarcina sp. Marseille-Q4063]
MIAELLRDWQSFCVENNFVGIGSTRKVYRWENYVFKVNLHEIGYLQSQRELEIYKYMKKNDFGKMFAPTYYADEQVCIQHYFKELPMYDYQSFDINERVGFWDFPNQFEECLELLDTKFDVFDIRDSSNYGLNNKNELVLIDYGMSKTLYETAWVPAAENGEVPQIEIEVCEACGIKKSCEFTGKKTKICAV